MIALVIDMVIVWFLLNIFSDENWDDQKLKVFGIVIAISLLGGFAADQSAPYVGVFPAVAAYFIAGTLCLWGLASLELKKALAAMGVFTAVKVVLVAAVLFFFSR